MIKLNDHKQSIESLEQVITDRLNTRLMRDIYVAVMSVAAFFLVLELVKDDPPERDCYPSNKNEYSIGRMGESGNLVCVIQPLKKPR